MCLYVDLAKTRKMQKGKSNYKIKIYKVLKYDTYYKEAITPYKYTEVAGGKFDSGELVPIKLGNNGSAIHCGIHAFRIKKYAKILSSRSNGFVVECYGLRKNLIAVGIYDDIVFTEIFIPKKVLRKAVSAYKRKLKE